eukprot:807568-Amphidinium_carterae.1
MSSITLYSETLEDQVVRDSFNPAKSLQQLQGEKCCSHPSAAPAGSHDGALLIDVCKGADADEEPAEWGYVPASDIFLVVGDGIVGVQWIGCHKANLT